MTAGDALVAIGGADLVMGLALLGIETLRADSDEEARAALEQALQDPATRLVFIDESRAEGLREMLEAGLQDAGRALVVEVPAATGHADERTLDERIERALGLKLRT